MNDSFDRLGAQGFELIEDQNDALLGLGDGMDDKTEDFPFRQIADLK
jgi:hypothetical protein